MPPEVLRPETPSGYSGSSESVDGRLLQERLRLFGGIAFLISAAFYAVGQVLAWLGRESHSAVEAHLAHLGIQLLMGGTWLYCRSGVRPERALRALDILLMLVMGVLALLVPSGSIPEPDLQTMVMLLAVNLVLYARAIFVPSSARRTLAVSVVTAVPLAVYSLSHETVRLSVWKVMWLLAAITIATAGSAVIYGLRREVRARAPAGPVHARGEARRGRHGRRLPGPPRHAPAADGGQAAQPERMGEAGLRRFEREVQLTAGLTHPNTVAVFDYGRTPDGVFYYAMEYLEGLGLDQLVAADGPQPPARVVHILRQVLEALAEAHGVGLVHRDIKPANIILCERGGLPDVAKVVDFGLVKDLEADAGRDPRRRAGRHSSLPRAGGDPLPRRRRASRPVLARGRGLLPPDRPARVRGPDDHRDLRAPPAHAAHAAFGAARTSPAGRPRGLGPLLPREGPGPTPGLRVRGGGAPRAVRPRRRVEPGRGPRLVGGQGSEAGCDPSRGRGPERFHALPTRRRARGLRRRARRRRGAPRSCVLRSLRWPT